MENVENDEEKTPAPESRPESGFKIKPTEMERT